MANIMNPVFSVGGVERTAPPVKSAQESGDKFSDHLDRKMQDRMSRDDKIGGKRRQEGQQSAKRAAVEKDRDVAAPKKKTGSDAEAAGALALFMQDLQQIAQSPELGVGEWIVPVEDGDFMQEFAVHSGMSELDLLALTEKFQAADGSLDLPSFFNALGEHFADFETNPGVLIPETEFPLLASLLEKMGLSGEQLQLLSDRAVAGDGQLDLVALIEALAALQGGGGGPEAVLQPVMLSKAEAQQLQDLLGKVGLQLGEQLELLPEQLFGKDVILSLERLQSMLEQGMNEAESAFPKVDLAAFLQDLERVMGGAKFVDQSAGISPLVQNSLVDAYKNLLDMFEAVQERFKEGLADEEILFSAEVEKWRAGVVERLAALTGMDPKHISVESLGLTTSEVSGATPAVLADTLPSVTTGGGGQTVTVDLASGQVASTVDQPPPVRHFIPSQQQQIFDQLGLAIGRGLKSGEHHLVLRLHPVELGEVKIDLVMRGEEISAHFNIANSKVKQTLESSMEEFRQSMEQKGFTLGALHVSVGGQDDAGEAWQRFEMGWSGERLQAETLEDLPDDILYHTSNRDQYANQEQGVNLFV